MFIYKFIKNYYKNYSLKKILIYPLKWNLIIE